MKGVHYGISLQWGPNTLMYNTKKVKPAPNSWGVLYSSKYKGKITVPDNPIQIADAALYLSKTKPALGIKDPYELNDTQFKAAVDLLKKQRPLVKKYWASAGDEIDLFKNGGAVVGASWPYQTNTLKAAKAPVKDLIPKEGATGWADTWMISSKAKHPNCAVVVDQVGLDAEGAGPAGDLLRRDAGEHEGVQDHGPAVQGLVRPVPRATPLRSTSTRSSSGRRRRRTAATARATAWTTRSGSKPGLTSRVDVSGV